MTIRTFTELKQWCAGAAEEFGDASIPICVMAFRWINRGEDVAADELVCWQEDQDHLRLAPAPAIAIPIIPDDEPAVTPFGVLGFAAEQLGPGTWILNPSLNMPELLHGYVILTGVPNPAPWRRPRIILARSV